MRRKGELSPAGVDYGWPHQVALKAEKTLGKDYSDVHDFGNARGMCPRGHTFVRDGEWYNVFCFSDKSKAEEFLNRFDGEWSDHEKRKTEMRLQFEKKLPLDQRKLHKKLGLV